MADFPTWMPVVALALTDAAGRLLLQQRPLGKHHGGLWEFPGGKVQPFEHPREAVVREIAEELGLVIERAHLLPALVADEAGQSAVVLILYTAIRWQGEPAGLEGQEWGWFSAAEAAGLPLAPMDRDLLARFTG
jgi:8-oxo-dGTP diphosphatase